LAPRDKPECGKSEFDGLLDDRAPGVSATPAFDVNEDVSVPYLNLAAAAVARFGPSRRMLACCSRARSIGAIAS